MAYTTVAELRKYLDQVPAGSAVDETLDSMLDRSTAIVRGVLRTMVGEHQLDFLAAGGNWPAASDKIVDSLHTPYLRLPAHQIGSVTAVIRRYDNFNMQNRYEETSDGKYLVLYKTTNRRHLDTWRGERYTVTAVWGYGPPPDDVIEVVLEIAVNMWHSHEAGRFSNVVGVEGDGAVGYEGTLTPQQKMTLKNVAKQYKHITV